MSEENKNVAEPKNCRANCDIFERCDTGRYCCECINDCNIRQCPLEFKAGKRETRSLPVELTPEEFHVEALALTSLISDKDRYEDEKASYVKTYNELIKDKEKEISTKAKLVTSGRVDRKVECVWHLDDPSKGQKQLYRTDNGAPLGEIEEIRNSDLEQDLPIPDNEGQDDESEQGQKLLPAPIEAKIVNKPLPLKDGTEPNEHGVYEKDTPTLSYSKGKVKIAIYAAELENGEWISAHEIETKDGGTSSPLSADLTSYSESNAVLKEIREAQGHLLHQKATKDIESILKALAADEECWMKKAETTKDPIMEAEVV